MELSEEHIAKRLKDEDVNKKTSSFLYSLGTGIKDIIVGETDLTDLEKKLRDGIHSLLSEGMETETNLLGSNTKKSKLELIHLENDGDNVDFEFHEESLGTRAMMSLLPNIFIILKQGGLYVVDEIESSMHSVLTTAIVKLFNSKRTNPNGAQLLFTTHESHILSGSFVRRDQVYLCEKCDVGSSYILPLSDYDIKKGDDLRKGYLEGRFGAVPYSSGLAKLLIKDDTEF